jgi:ribonuclease R
LPAEGFVTLASLPNDRYRFEKHGHVIEGFRSGNRYRMGDLLTVKIEEVDLPRRALLLSVVSHLNTKESGSNRQKGKSTDFPKRKGKRR